VLLALAPSLVAALALTLFFFARGDHLWLPGVWMLCYAQGALATAAYSPPPIRWLGVAVLFLGGLTLALDPTWAVPMNGAGVRPGTHWPGRGVAGDRTPAGGRPVAPVGGMNP